MQPNLILAGALLVPVLGLTGCESDGGVARRSQEKSATYAALSVSQKRLITRGTISEGFTPDMVYIAMGPPSKVETGQISHRPVELWTYRQYYPNVDAIHGFRHASFTTESAYQPQRPTTVKNENAFVGTGNQPGPPVGMGIEQTSFLTGGPQGGSMEPSNLRSYTIKVLFASGKVVQIGANENWN